MDQEYLRELLDRVKSGDTSIDTAMESLKLLPYQDLGFAKIDHHRFLRKNMAEVVLGEGKTPEQLTAIAAAMALVNDKFLITRASVSAFDSVKSEVKDVTYNSVARAIVFNRHKNPLLTDGITIVSAGTADLPVVEEAVVTCELFGNRAYNIRDVGVAGIHRLIGQLDKLNLSKVIIAVAGMEGALPGVVAGLVSAPVIAVPTSVGYGVGIGGLAAIMAMLSACAPGVATVNIDNGFGAGYMASAINSTQG